MDQLHQSWRDSVKKNLESLTQSLHTKLEQLKSKKEELQQKLCVLEMMLEQLETSAEMERTLRTQEIENLRHLFKNLQSHITSYPSTLEKSSTRLQNTSQENVAAVTQKLGEVEIHDEGIESQLDQDQLALQTLEALVGASSEELQSGHEIKKDLSRPVDELKRQRDHEERQKYLPKNCGTWRLDGGTTFQVQKAMGIWFMIEMLAEANSPTTIDPKTVEFIFTLTGNTIEETRRYRINSSSKKETWKLSHKVDTQSSHCWTNANCVNSYSWIETDYDNYGIFVYWDNKDVSFCRYVYILSRERTLPHQILKMLKDTAALHVACY